MERLFLECAVRAALLVAGTALVLWAMRVRAAAAKHGAWTAVVFLMLLLPMWTAWGPKVPVRLLPPLDQRTVNEAVVPKATFSAAALPPDTTNLKIPESAARRPVWNWQEAFLCVYLLGLFSLLLRLAIGTVQAHILVRQAALCDGRRTSFSCASPVTVGWLHPTVILPKQWRQWTQAQLDAVLTHEGAHARRRDPLVQWLALLNRAVFWFHPAAWWLERELSALAEEACDSAVLARGHNPRDYSEYLIDMARSIMRSGARVSVVGMTMPGARLPQRIRRIIEGGPVPRISRTKMACLATACTITCTVFAAGTLDHTRQGVPALSTVTQHELQAVGAYAKAREAASREEQLDSRESAIASQKPPTASLAQSSTSSQSPARNAPVTQEDASDRLIIDSVSVKRNTSENLFGPIGMSGNHFSAYNSSLQDLLQVAYQMTILQEMPEELPSNFQWTGFGTGLDMPLQAVSGAPPWLNTERFDIEADVSGNYIPSPAQKLLVLQTLLSELFKLRVHHETRSRPAYALVLSRPGKIGPQIHAASTLDVLPSLPLRDLGTALGRQQITQITTMEAFAASLTGAANLDPKLSLPVVDRTGLSGIYDLTVEWASPSDRSGPAFLTALQEQVGLKLVPQTNPVDVFVIDHVEQPSRN